LEADHVLSDLRSRLLKAAESLVELRDEAKDRSGETAADWQFSSAIEHAVEAARLEGKRQGIMLAVDYLRAYTPDRAPSRIVRSIEKEVTESGEFHVLHFVDGTVERVQLG
jgi:hypothetical protein